MFVKPAPGLLIPDPDLRDYLSDEGREVPDTSYWHRRLSDGDVVAAKPETPATAVTPTIAATAATPERSVKNDTAI
ncbi:hypothetical protein AAKU55_005814 [Oxalobacteraceae bacterium GrIS 1.11]